MCAQLTVKNMLLPGLFAGKDGNTVTSGTTVVDGLLTIAAGQTGELIVKASVNIGTVGTPVLVTGESIVTVVQ